MSKDDLTNQPATWPAIAWGFLKSPKAGWILFAITAFLLLFNVTATLAGLNPIGTVTKTVPDNKIEPILEKDPLGIEGTWKYTTYVNDARKPYKAIQGVNFLINFDGCGYSMHGKRTHYMGKDSTAFQEYNNPILIDISRTVFSYDRTRFYFYFEVKGIEEIDRSEGFVELQIVKSNKSKMEGIVHYLHSDKTWSIANIIFERQ